MESKNGQSAYADNQGFNNANALQVRLDVSEVLKDIENFLRGKKIDYRQNKAGEIEAYEIKVGQAKCNKLGVQSIMSFIRTIINTQTVQGNFVVDNGADSSMYYNYCSNARLDLSEAIVLNIHQWAINKNEAELIIDSIMNIVVPFMTRLIDNKERDSYSNTIRHEEKNTLTKEDNKFKLFA